MYRTSLPILPLICLPFEVRQTAFYNRFGIALQKGLYDVVIKPLLHHEIASITLQYRPFHNVKSF